MPIIMVMVDQLQSARAALQAGQALLADGQLRAGRKLLDYAQRIAPKDDELALQAALARLRDHDPDGAIALLKSLAERHDRQEIWLSLANAYRIQGDVKAAAASLRRFLKNYAVFQGIDVLANDIAQRTSHPGWCGISADGLVRIGPDMPPDLRVTMDGVALEPHTGVLQLPDGWADFRQVEITSRGVALLGSPISPGTINHVEAFVEAHHGALRGWAWMPGQPDHTPRLRLHFPDGRTAEFMPDDAGIDTSDTGLLSRPRGFVIPASVCAGQMRITGPSGRDITGSPLDPAWDIIAAKDAAHMAQACFPAARMAAPLPIFRYPIIPAGLRGPACQIVPARRPIDVVIPVYRGLAETWACLQALLADPVPDCRIVVVEDASPDADLIAALTTLEQAGRIILLRQPQNRGFPATANAGLRHAAGRDVVLLNNDTVPPPGWLARLRDAAYAAADIGTVTPLSNDASILSYPSADKPNAVPDKRKTLRLDQAAWRAHGDHVVDIPVGVGFCMLIRHDCLAATGVLRDDVFAQGYGEEVDFCLRATALGWRHVGHMGVFVGHIGGQSFGGAKTHLIRRNSAIIERLHPGFDAMVRRFEDDDPIAPARRKIDRLRWLDRGEGGVVLLISHARGGGVQRHVDERARTLQQAGQRSVLLIPSENGDLACHVRDPFEPDETPNLQFAMPQEWDALVEFLRALKPVASEWHHFIGHHPLIAGLHRALSIPQTMVIHDFSLFCPRVTLTQNARYCGEPALRECGRCLADHGSELEEETLVPDLIARSAGWLQQAERIVAPTRDTAARLERHFGEYLPRMRCHVQAWEDDLAPGPAHPDAAGPIRVCVVGGISPEKGFDILLACARDAADRALNMRFHLVGFSIDDPRLLATGMVEITGPFAQKDASALIAAARAHIGFLPSQWPETWSYVLSDLRRAGLKLAAFDIGAQAERLKYYRGLLLPLGLPADRVNDALMAY